MTLTQYALMTIVNMNKRKVKGGWKALTNDFLFKKLLPVHTLRAPTLQGLILSCTNFTR